MQFHSRVLLAACALACAPVTAAHALCASPLSGREPPVASDCLFILRSAVGSQPCDLCLCDANSSGGITSSDALVCLRAAVGQSVTLTCVTCDGTTNKDDLIDDIPALSVDPPTPVGSSTVTVKLTVPGANSFTLTASGDGCGQFDGLNVAMAGGQFEDTRNAGPFGECLLHADVDGGSGMQELTSAFTVAPNALILPAVKTLGGIFTPGDLPSPTDGGPQIKSIEGPGTLINGGAARFELEATAITGVAQVLVKVPGDPDFNGYFVVPAVTEGDAIVVQLQLDREFGSPSSALQQRRQARQLPRGIDSIEVEFVLVDADGRISASFARQLDITLVGTSGLQVSLSWNTPTDVDLHLVEPEGEEIYYGNELSLAGGVLDLDSNAGCSIDGVNNENITYPDTSPPSGEYIVRVDFWSACEDLGANFTVTTNVCGESTVYEGSFAPEDEDFGGAGAGREIARFTLSCEQRVRGMATYEDHGQTPEGLATASSLPIRFAQVEVRRTEDDEVLATGDTEQDGTFDILFHNDGALGYYVLVKTKQANAFLSQSVVNAAGELYSVRSIGSIDESKEPDKVDLEIHAVRAGPGPAFNIFDVGVDANRFLKQTLGAVPPELTWQWTDGQKGFCSGKVSCYRDADRRISVLSIPEDPDEYDDLVLLHEYGHFFQSHYSRADSPGGPHSSRNRVNSLLAWDEGSATFFGNRSRETSLYLDTGPDGVNNMVEIENLSEHIPLGTDFGDVSEALVAAILWDLADATNEGNDTETRQTAVFGALRKLGDADFDTRDAGAPGADLVDLLNAWFCKGNNERGDATSGLEGIVVGMHQFNYDFPDVEPCP